MAWSENNAELAKRLLALTGCPSRTTERARKAVEHAVVAADEFGARAVDSRHLLCGLLRGPEGVAFGILRHVFELTKNPVEEVLATAGNSDQKSPTSLDDDLSTVMTTAATCSASMHHNYIGTEHLLLGVVAPGTKSAKLLADLGIHNEPVTHEVTCGRLRRTWKRTSEISTRSRTLTDRALWSWKRSFTCCI